MISDREADIGSDLHWACAAAGKPRPAVRWLRNGEPLTSQVRDLGRPSPCHPAHCALLPGPLPHTPGGPLGQLGCRRVVLGASVHPRATSSWSAGENPDWRVPGLGSGHTSATNAPVGLSGSLSRSGLPLPSLSASLEKDKYHAIPNTMLGLSEAKTKHRAWPLWCHTKVGELACSSRDVGSPPGWVTSDKPPHLPSACIAHL